MKIQLNDELYKALFNAHQLSGLSMSDIVCRSLRWRAKNADKNETHKISAESGRKQVYSPVEGDQQFIRETLAMYIEAKPISTPHKKVFPFGSMAEMLEDESLLPF